MSKKNDGGPAFPTSSENYDEVNLEGSGMTLRDYFAAKFASAMTPPKGVVGTVQKERRKIAIEAYIMADAMLEARNE